MFLSNEPLSPSESLHKASTFRLDARVRNCVLDLQDDLLMAKLSVWDLVAQDAQYHARCLPSPYNRTSSLNFKADHAGEDSVSHGIDLAELETYMEEARQVEMVSPVFKLAYLCRSYFTGIEELNVLKTAKEGRNIRFAFQENIGQALRKAYEKNYYDVAMHLAIAANMVRKDMHATFTGSSDEDRQHQSEPPSLLELVAMIHEGASSRAQSNRSGMTQATLSTAQLKQ